MTLKDRINGIISKFGIYDTENNIFVKAETEAYCAGISAVTDSFFDAVRECFAVTAEDFGLEEMEGLFGSPDSYSTVEQRRERLLNSLSVDETAFTRGGMERFLGSFCDSFSITEDPPHNTVTVTLQSNSRIAQDSQRYIGAVKEFFPAHLDVRVSIQETLNN